MRKSFLPSTKVPEFGTTCRRGIRINAIINFSLLHCMRFPQELPTVVENIHTLKFKWFRKISSSLYK